MTFRIGQRAFVQCIIAKSSRFSGADIFLEKNGITIEPGIPEMRTRILVGSGALLLKIFSRNFSAPAVKIKGYLEGKYENVKFRS
ncbi:hypothetical protein ACFOTA_03960 [Chitinophaga sp. GCM10012297]|uniref:Uncharacterized protein n=1 Tax=Chitinophaga chungangae TaxID=2821488 RepID=A0ABS3Y9J8_9BACT|nr:hypothetical protein [Chitinophaga chungangae]MBO9151349.1 hypothetical protein [Chitinophaga chungangae]